MNTITLQQAQSSLAELIHGMSPGQVVTITENDRPIARLLSVPTGAETPPGLNPNWPGYPHAGSCEGLFVVPDDFKDPLDELEEYVE